MKTELTEAPHDRLAHGFAATYCRAAHHNAKMIVETISRVGFDRDYHRNGWIPVRMAVEQTVIGASVHLDTTSGFDDWSRLTPNDVFETSGLGVEADAGFSVRAGTFHPAKLVWSLLWIVLERGNAALFIQTKVPHIEVQSEYYVGHISRGAIRGRHVINATEAYTTALHPQLYDIIRPLQSKVAAGLGGPLRLPSDLPVNGALWFGDRRGDYVLFGTDATRITDAAANQNRPSCFLIKFALGEMMSDTVRVEMEVTRVEWSDGLHGRQISARRPDRWQASVPYWGNGRLRHWGRGQRGPLRGELYCWTARRSGRLPAGI